MKILLFGVSNVGKTSVGKVLAEQLGYRFFDLDEEVKKEYHITLEEFVHTENLQWRDRKRGCIIKKILNHEDDIVFAITPISYPDNFKNHIRKEDVLAIEIVDTPENIFERLVFSDVNDIIYKDDEYKNARKEHYSTEIFEDLVWYGNINAGLGIINRIDVRNESPNQVAKRIIHEFVKINDDALI